MTVAQAPPSAAPRPVPVRRSLGWRRAKNRMAWVFGGAALALVVAPVVSVVWGIVANAVPHWQWRVLTTDQIGNGGGLRNALEGTAVIVVGVLVLAGALGIAGGVYLAEYCSEGKGQILRGASEVLSGVPSIVLGYVGFIALVVGLHWQYSLGAALVVLSALVIPYITKTTEVAIRNVPTAYREGAEALGMRSGLVLRRLVLRPALPGIVTGLIVAAAIAVGETAPLLYTAGWSTRDPTLALTHSPIGYLTYAVFTFYSEPYPSAHQLASSAALLLVTLVLLLIVVSRLVVSFTQRYSPERQAKVSRRRPTPVTGAPPAP